MNLVRKTNPWFPSLLDEFITRDLGVDLATRSQAVPAVNISETDTAFSLVLAAPGKTRKDFQIELDEHILTISSDSNTEHESSHENFTRKEFSYESFQRSFRLPDTVNTQAIKANYKEGILTVELPKLKEAIPEPKKTIEVK
ncbi:MAG: Hsp20/alpha crystallin family protein [Flavobacteriaceae bacterium]|nr:Hsp20/alpha crystallin family protein [Flavobacteriaceae bacterium]